MKKKNEKAPCSNKIRAFCVRVLSFLSCSNMIWAIGVVVLFLSPILVIHFYRCHVGTDWSSKPEDWSSFGQYFGGLLAPIFAGLAFIGTLILYVQAKRTADIAEITAMQAAQIAQGEQKQRQKDFLIKRLQSLTDTLRTLGLRNEKYEEYGIVLGRKKDGRIHRSEEIEERYKDILQELSPEGFLTGAKWHVLLVEKLYSTSQSIRGPADLLTEILKVLLNDGLLNCEARSREFKFLGAALTTDQLSFYFFCLSAGMIRLPNHVSELICIWGFFDRLTDEENRWLRREDFYEHLEKIAKKHMVDPAPLKKHIQKIFKKRDPIKW